MPDPTPRQVTMTEVNTEIEGSGSSTVIRSFNNNTTRNLAFRLTSSSEIRASNLAYGLAIPGRTGNYDGNGGLNIGYMAEIESYAVNSQSAANVSFFSNGVGHYIEAPSVYGNDTFTFTQADSNTANYWLQLNKTTGTTPTGNAVNTDIRMNGNINWRLSVNAPPGSGNSNSADFTGNLIIKYSTDNGTTKTEYFRRPITVSVLADRI